MKSPARDKFHVCFYTDPDHLQQGSSVFTGYGPDVDNEESTTLNLVSKSIRRRGFCDSRYKLGNVREDERKSVSQSLPNGFEDRR